MKKTQWLAMLMDIKGSIVSFLSIMLFVALGIAIFLGIKWNEPALSNAVSDYYDERDYHDLQLVFPYGFTKDDIKAVDAIDGVDAEGAYSTHGIVWVDGNRYVMVIQSLTERVDTAVTIKGVMPVANNEIGVEEFFAEETGIQLGDKLTVETVDGEFLRSTELTITAIVEHPSYIRNENAYSRGLSDIGDGTVNCYALVAPEAFNPDAFDNCYSQLLLRSECLKGLNALGEEYEAGAKELSALIESVGAKRAPIRTESVFERYSSEIADAEKKLADAEDELENGRLELQDGKTEFENAEQRIIDGEQELLYGERELAAARRKYNKGSLEYSSGVAALESALSQLQSGLSQGGFNLNPSTAKGEINDKLAYLNKVRPILAEFKQLVDDYIADPTIFDENDFAALIKELAVAGYKISDATLDELIDVIDNSTLSDTEKDHFKDIIEEYRTDPEAITEARLAELLAELRVLLEIQAKLNEISELLKDKLAEFDDGISKLGMLLSYINQYLDGEAQLEGGRAALVNAAELIKEGERRIRASRAELEAAREKLPEYRLELKDAEKQLADGETELAENRLKLEEAKADFAALVRSDNWTLQTRSANPSFGTAKSTAESSEKLCYTMALLFVFVGIMVCYTAISRLVREAQVMTGVQKALGFRAKEVLARYMTYSGLAVLLGSLLGGALGYFVIERIVNDAFMQLFVIDTVTPSFSLRDFLTISLVELILVCVATYLPCRKHLRRPAVELMQGDTPNGGRTRFYERFKVWKRSSLFTQTTINNLAGDGSRVIATLVGVAGCTALIVMSLSLQSSLDKTPLKHFSEIAKYEARLVCDDRVSGAQNALRARLDRQDVSYTSIMSEAVFIEDSQSDGSLFKTDIIVPEDPHRYDDFISLKDWKSGRILDFPSEGAIVSETYAMHHNVDAGDSIRLLDMSGRYHTCEIVGVSKYYISANQLVMSSEYYESIMGKTAESNTFYINYETSDPVTVRSSLEKTDGFFSLVDDRAKWVSTFATATKSTSLVVGIGLALSVTMALLVLLNLNVVCISEKSKELIIMRINGFSISDAKKYVYRDNIVLTALGVLLGVAFGVWIAYWVVQNLQGRENNFYKLPDLMSCLVGAGMSSVFSLITNLIALRRVDKLKVTDINKP